MKNNSKYAAKRRSGNMMYGPAKKVPKWPEFVNHNPPANQYWWGETRKKPVDLILLRNSL